MIDGTEKHKICKTQSAIQRTSNSEDDCHRSLGMDHYFSGGEAGDEK